MKEAKEIKMQAGVVDNTMSEHLIFLGNPGTSLMPKKLLLLTAYLLVPQVDSNAP